MKYLRLYLFITLLLLCAAGHACTINKKSTYAESSVAAIQKRGTLLVGTTGDYRPLTYREPASGDYWGFDLEVAQRIAEHIGVPITYIQTSWPTLTGDVLNKTLFDFAIGGITITNTRKITMDMSDGYLVNGKTILCRKKDASKFQSLTDLNKPTVRVMVNPGGLNEKFAREKLPHAIIIVHPKNEEIPAQVAEGKADVMITEITEAPYYEKTDMRLAAPLLNKPFTHGEIGVLIRRGQDDLLHLINTIIAAMKKDGSLQKLHTKYGLVYRY
ncbi:transporter substrate-binding domain-containing protein [uncultured Desulfovibrio sp.]|uniref:transporter substrate-binding domain-containing protein n=1 Tax=uncultured Desulfovibrio sp. TaxID=167968 RepID=UPI0026164974|nr:transporter substrate-binding domain-containing protein [uncultured Desulfovibrio sp.]